MVEHGSGRVWPEEWVGPLVARARAGDAEAFSVLYQRHRRGVRLYARRLAPHHHHADDLVAEAFTRTWAQLRAGRGPTSGFVAYVRATVLHLHLSYLRREQRISWVQDIDQSAMANPELAARIAERSPEDQVLEQVVGELFNERMKEALATLPPRWQQVLVMVYIENRPYQEIADLLGLNPVAVRQLGVRARAGMRRALEALTEQDYGAA